MRIARKRGSAGMSGAAMINVVFLATVSIVAAIILAADRGLDVSAETRDVGVGFARSGVVMVYVGADGGLTIDGKPVVMERLADVLRTKIDPGSSPAVISQPVVLLPDRAAPYGAVVDALDELRQARARLRLGHELNVSFARSAVLQFRGL